MFWSQERRGPGCPWEANGRTPASDAIAYQSSPHPATPVGEAPSSFGSCAQVSTEKGPRGPSLGFPHGLEFLVLSRF